MESRQEYQRILDNPDNIILSDDLKEILLDQEDAVESHLSNNDITESKIDNSYLLFEKERFPFHSTKIKRITQNTFLFEGNSITFPIAMFLDGKAFKIKLFNMLFSLEESFPVIYKESGMLTFTARRIIKNEEV